MRTSILSGTSPTPCARGRQLEGERRWGDALSQYEESLRQHPTDATLQERFDFARLHYDLERRYADRSFCDTVVRLSPERALELYSQVLLKIDSHYVEVPQWKDLVDRGSDNLEVALSEPTFVERNVAEADPAGGRRLPATSCEPDGLRPAVGSRNDAASPWRRRPGWPNSGWRSRPVAVCLEYLCGATNALDPYSAYLTPDQLNEVYAQIEGQLRRPGRGIEGPGRRAGDRPRHLRQSRRRGRRAGRRPDPRSSTASRPRASTTDQAANLLQGTEGSIGALTAGRPRPTAAPAERPPPRGRGAQRRSGGNHRSASTASAIFKLTCFQKTTARDLDAALWKLHRDGMKSLVIDVRGNPGGLLVSAVEVVDRFVDRGVIVSTRGRSAQEDFTYSAHEQGKWRMPLVVMIDQDSASAAEIFAGAIRDHHRGTIVGVRSFGKGSVQGIFPLDESNSGVRLTTAKFYSPNGKPYSRVGVEPDVRSAPCAGCRQTGRRSASFRQLGRQSNP